MLGIGGSVYYGFVRVVPRQLDNKVIAQVRWVRPTPPSLPASPRTAPVRACARSRHGPRGAADASVCADIARGAIQIPVPPADLRAAPGLSHAVPAAAHTRALRGFVRA